MSADPAADSLLPDWTPLPADHFSRMALTGSTLRTILDRPTPSSPLPGFLDPRPSLHLLVASPKVGKTTLCATLAVAASAGIAPWRGAPALPQGRVLFVTSEEGAAHIAATMDRVANRLGVAPEHWTERLGVIAADDLLQGQAEDVLTLNAGGRDHLERILESSRKRGAPVRFLFLDSASSLSAGAGVDENDNSAVTAWLRPLQGLAIRGQVLSLLDTEEGDLASDERTAGAVRFACSSSSSVRIASS